MRRPTRTRRSPLNTSQSRVPLVTSRTGQPRALIYVRKSTADKRSPDARSRSTEEQEAESRAWCKREGWRVVGVEIDDGVSASRHSTRKRPGWDAVERRI